MSRSTGTDDPESELHFAECETDRFQTYLRPEVSRSVLIPSNDVTLGMWQRFGETYDTRASGMYKVKGV